MKLSRKRVFRLCRRLGKTGLSEDRKGLRRNGQVTCEGRESPAEEGRVTGGPTDGSRTLFRDEGPSPARKRYLKTLNLFASEGTPWGRGGGEEPEGGVFRPRRRATICLTDSGTVVGPDLGLLRSGLRGRVGVG